MVEGTAPVALALPPDAPLPEPGASLSLAVAPAACRIIPLESG
jgi:hypothetical protein